MMSTREAIINTHKFDSISLARVAAEALYDNVLSDKRGSWTNQLPMLIKYTNSNVDCTGYRRIPLIGLLSRLSRSQDDG